MANTLTVIVRMTAQEGTAEELQDHITKMVLSSRAEKGCIRYVLKRGVDDPNVFVMVEEWRSRAAWDMHVAGDSVATFRASVPDGMVVSREVHPLTTVA